MLAKKAITRGFAAAASAKTQPITAHVESKVSRLPNGLTAASVELNGAVSSLVLAYRAGARYQQPDEASVVHTLRNCVGKDSEDYLGVKLLWQLGSVGGNLVSYATKDTFAVQLDVVRDHSPVAISLLGEFASPALKAWNVEEATHSIQLDLNKQQPADIVRELLHKSAYRNGALATPILAPFHQQHARFDQVQNFARSRLLAGEAVLLGVNVEHDDLIAYGEQQTAIKEGRGQKAAGSPYLGGHNVRVEAATAIAHVMIAGEGVGLGSGDAKAIAAQEVLAALIGASPGHKFSNSANAGAGAVVAAAVEASANKRPVGVSAVHQLHADSGLVGVYVACEGAYAEPAVRAAWGALKKLAADGASGEQLAAAQKAAALDALLHVDSPAHMALDQAHFVLANGELAVYDELVQRISEVTADDIKKAAKRIVEKPSLGAYGRLNQVPYLDQL